jgi:hypothetical protein
MKFKQLSGVGALLLIPISVVELKAHVSRWSPTSLFSSESRQVEHPPSVAQVSSCVQMILDGFDEAHTSGMKVELEINTTIFYDDAIAEGGLESLHIARFDSGRFHSILSNEIEPGVVSTSEAIYIDDLYYIQDGTNEWFVVETPVTLPQFQEQFAQFQNPEGISNCQVIGTTVIDGIETTLIEFNEQEVYSMEDYSEAYEHQVRLWLTTDGLPHRVEVSSTGFLEEDGERLETVGEAVHTYDYNADFEILPPI